jgi:pyruvate/2-oxoglutarate dehydrogenase complex dihydrolipoamide acyltransferase (E2) component
MEARVKEGSRIAPVYSCGGILFLKEEWRLVPAGCEGEARVNPYLEIRETEEAEPEAITEIAPEPVTDIDTQEAGFIDASIAAGDLASEKGIDLKLVAGSGKDGKITITDVRDYIALREEGDADG